MSDFISELIKQGDYLWGKRASLESLWQEIADNFYVERADFTTKRYLGDEFAAHLTTSYPLLVRRDLGNAFSAMLRPSDKEWFRIAADGVEDYAGKAWMDWATKLQKRAMYEKAAQFVRATKEGDHDFAGFGQTVISVELRPDRSGLLYRCWHLRDVVWCEGFDGQAETVHRKWRPTVYQLFETFGKEKMTQKLKDRMEKDPHCEVECRHIVIPARMYKGEMKVRTPLVSIYLNVEDNELIEETPTRTNPYVIPRWQTVSGSQYAYSAATVCALPDARLLQAMTLTLLEAGEKAVNPPMIATQEAIRGDVSLYAGGITWVDQAYDERLGEVLRPLTIDKSGIPLGMEMSANTQMMLRQAFFLDKLDLPMRTPEMTAYEVGQRVQEYIRNALPLFEPVETDYNGGLCERTFGVLFDAGAFGPITDIPPSLSEKDIQFKFVSPLRDAIEKQKSQTFAEASQVIAQAVSLDPGAAYIVDAKVALRDTLEGIGVPTKWTRSEEAVQKIADEDAAMQQQQQALAALQQGATVAKDLNEVVA
jgi:hypothetical protein